MESKLFRFVILMVPVIGKSSSDLQQILVHTNISLTSSCLCAAITLFLSSVFVPVSEVRQSILCSVLKD